MPVSARREINADDTASTSSADLSKTLKNLKLDNRKTFDEAIEARREEVCSLCRQRTHRLTYQFQPQPLPRKRDRRPPPPFQQVKSSVLERIKRDEEESEKAIRARLRPRVPKDVTPEQNEIVSYIRRVES